MGVRGGIAVPVDVFDIMARALCQKMVFVVGSTETGDANGGFGERGFGKSALPQTQGLSWHCCELVCRIAELFPQSVSRYPLRSGIPHSLLDPPVDEETRHPGMSPSQLCAGSTACDLEVTECDLECKELEFGETVWSVAV
ncbi:hypothetical protein AV530_010060 [Patagioenas fasciata monilis]|uniref:Uncharacterized protein n=1 Tax=Patagioenas fasciata monilis TaxID=372326 RepID=A0A1V4KXQ5_PATFA|nr:hypothetical protein AV530_010060 [Patagioenas fasciata monilis]